MKYSDYLNAEPTPKKINSTVNIRDEHRETILEHKIASLTAELTKFKDQSAELAEVKGHNTSLLIDQRKMSNTLNNTQSTLHVLESRLDNEVELKQEIKSLEHQLQTHQHHFEELNTKATVDARLLLEQEEKIMKLEKLNNTLETDNNHLALQTKYAEQKQTDAAGVVQYLEKQFKEIEGTSAQLMEDYLAMQKDLSSNIEQRKSLRRQVSRLEDELKAVQALNSSLHESVQSLQGFYDTSQNQLHYAEKTTSTLDDTVKNLMGTLNAVEQENKYLVDKQQYLETELARPKYMSQSLIERQEGFKMPLASSALNVRKNYLGTGKPTLLKFKKKELVNDNT